MKTFRAALGLTLFFFLFTGVAYPLAMTALSQAIFPAQANGSLIKQNGKFVGSALIGQNFADAKHFHPRPSAAGSGYDGANSSGTNLGPNSAKLLKGVEGFDGVEQLAFAYRKANGLEAGAVVPADAVTRSASGLDPHISVENARIQTSRVAEARGVPVAEIEKLITEATERPFLGVFGEAAVNVLKLNLSLNRTASKQ